MSDAVPEKVKATATHPPFLLSSLLLPSVPLSLTPFVFLSLLLPGLPVFL